MKSDKEFAKEKARAKFNSRLAISVVGVLGIILSLQLYIQVRQNHIAELKATFSRLAEGVSASVKREVEYNLNAVRAVSALYAASKDVERDEFHAFSELLLLHRPGIKGLEWVPKIMAKDRAAFEAAVRAEGFADFEIWERTAANGRQTAGQRYDYFPVNFIEPLAGNEAAVGYDLASEPVRKKALVNAYETGALVATPPVKLVQESGDSLALVVLKPIYQKQKPLDTAAQRYQFLDGFVLGIYRVENLTKATEESSKLVAFSITDVTGPEGPQLIYGKAEKKGESGKWAFGRSEVHSLSIGEVIDVAGRRWSLVLRPTEEFAQRLGLFTGVWALISGLIFTLFIVIYLWNITGKTAAVEREVEQRTSELKEANRKLKDAGKRAIEASRAKSDFLATMSHEIRTPMNSILGMTDLLSESKLDPDQAEQVQVLRRSGDALLELINDILDLTKIEAGMIELEAKDFDLKSFMENTMEFLAVRAREKGLDFNFEIHPKTHQHWKGDYGRLRQVLMNLVSNSIKFTKRGEIKIQIEEMHWDKTEAEGLATLMFSVRDTGIGIPKEQVDRIFDPFTQADSSMTRKFGGTGLGLSICRKLLQLMNGRIWVESEPNKGSSFFFTVQMQRSDAAAPLDDPSKKKKDPVSEEWDEEAVRRILVAEDSADNRLLIARYLKNAPVEVDMAENGEEAVTMFSKKEYDLILMDIQMPVMDGYRATMVIRKMEKKRNQENGSSGKHLPILALSANAFKEDINKSITAGCDEHLVKPVKKAVLLETLMRYFKQSQNNGKP